MLIIHREDRAQQPHPGENRTTHRPMSFSLALHRSQHRVHSRGAGSLRPASAAAESEAKPWNVYLDDQPSGWPSQLRPENEGRTPNTENNNSSIDKEKKTYRAPEQYRIQESEIYLPNYSEILEIGRAHV